MLLFVRFLKYYKKMYVYYNKIVILIIFHTVNMTISSPWYFGILLRCYFL